MRWPDACWRADVLTGFVTENGDAMGRPVGVVIDSQGALLVADDVGNVIWRVAGTADRAPGDEPPAFRLP